MNYPSYHPPSPLATPVTLTYPKIPKMTLPIIYQLSTAHLLSILSWISTFLDGGRWVVKLVIIRTKANSVQLALPTLTELGNKLGIKLPCK